MDRSWFLPPPLTWQPSPAGAVSDNGRWQLVAKPEGGYHLQRWEGDGVWVSYTGTQDDADHLKAAANEANVYCYCRVCGTLLANPDVVAWAFRRFEPPLCGTACVHEDTKRRHACCEQADFLPCVCMYAFTCPVHGQTHIGTHD